MDVRFDDHAAFQRAAAWAALGGAALAAVAPSAALWRWAFCGAFFALVLASARTEAPASARAVAAVLCAAIAVIAAHTLPVAALALSQALPRALADAAAGGALGLWLSLAAAPLHISIGADPVESRLSALRPSLNAELRALAERAAAARRCAAQELPAGARADLRGLLDSLALAALDLASRASELGRAAPSSLENDLQTRNAALAKSAAAADDERARQSYLRAAEALEGQLEHLRRVRRARERTLARLHEEVANLERARFSLTLLQGGDDTVELDLLHERLQHGALACEGEEELTAARPVLT